uniref:(northern house mosquito) hypothetical protein n=1 Tax=Culex pipiens TaxID=7175 RepID=A0A8D8L3J7_CULPI
MHQTSEDRGQQVQDRFQDHHPGRWFVHAGYFEWPPKARKGGNNSGRLSSLFRLYHLGRRRPDHPTKPGRAAEGHEREQPGQVEQPAGRGPVHRVHRRPTTHPFAGQTIQPSGGGNVRTGSRLLS